MQGDNSNKNMILAIVLSAVVLMGWQYFIVKPRVDERMAQEKIKTALLPSGGVTTSSNPVSGTSLESSSVGSSGEICIPTTPPTSPPIAGGITPSIPPVSSAPSVNKDVSLPTSTAQTASVGIPALSENRSVILEREKDKRASINTDTFQGTIALKATRFDDIVLKKYRETVDLKSPLVPLLSPSTSSQASFVELGYTSGVANLELPNSNTVWTLGENKTLTPTTPLTFTWQNNTGLQINRQVSVDSQYLISIKDQIVNKTNTDVIINPYALVKRNLKDPYTHEGLVHEGPLGWLGNQLQEVKYKAIKDSLLMTFESTGGWAGFSDKYWLTALVPPASEKVQARYLFDQGQNSNHGFQVDYQMSPRSISAGSTTEIEQRLFSGPKDNTLLQNYESDQKIAGLNYAIDWGFFWFFTKPIFWVLDHIFTVVQNFGIAILLLTFVIKGLFYPLANKSYTMMAKMRTLQPRMADIKKQFANDPMQQQKAVLELYQKEKVNPLSGCLPMIVQIPVFFALYKVLSITIEMRHAPFFGWIQDLSMPDPTNIFTLFGLIPLELPSFLHLGIWPVLMGITMFLQQKMSPSSPDPVQGRVMMFMPILFTFILAPFAAGLVIYWTWNNLLSIFQQWVITTRMMKETEGGRVEIITPSKKK
jgi:YidC/Oxa1 family membrane protein insertase